MQIEKLYIDMSGGRPDLKAFAGFNRGTPELDAIQDYYSEERKKLGEFFNGDPFDGEPISEVKEVRNDIMGKVNIKFMLGDRILTKLVYNKKTSELREYLLNEKGRVFAQRNSEVVFGISQLVDIIKFSRDGRMCLTENFDFRKRIISNEV